MTDTTNNSGRQGDELEELRKQNKQLHELLENSRDMLYRMSLPDGRYEYVSPSSSDLLGYSPQELYDHPQLIRNLIHPDWIDYFNDQWKLLIAGIMPPFYEYQIITRTGDTKWLNQRNVLVRDKKGNPEAIEGVVTDITAWKLNSEALDRRIAALTRPIGSSEELTFEELFDIDDMQRIQDEFALATGVAALITDTDGRPITRGSNFCRLCSNIIRETEQGGRNCTTSDAELGRYNPDGPVIQQCMSAGLWGAGAAITIEGRHIANWVIGQVRDDTQTEEEMREYARRIGADEDRVVEAFREVPAMSKEQFEQIANTLYTLATQLSSYAYQNLQQARFIAELESQEKELQLREIRLQEYQQMAQLGSWYWDIGSGEVQWSEQVYRIFRLDPNEFTPQIDSIMALSPWPGDRERHTEIMNKALQNKTLGMFEQRFLRPDGETGYYYSTFQGVYDADATLIAIKGTVQDITERKAAVEALKESETQLRTLIRTLPDLVWLKDTDGVYISCNSRFEDFFGAREEDIVGKTDYDFVDKELADFFRLHDKMAIEKGQPSMNEEEVVFASDGHRELLETIKTPMYRSDGELAGVLGIGRDITERRLAEEQLQIRERMDSIGTLASGIAHDFNNLLVGIMGNLDLLRIDNDNFTSEQSECLNESYELSHRAARLIRSLLSLTRSTTSDITSLDIFDVAQDVFAILTRTTDRLIEKKLDLTAGRYRVMGQYDQLHQVLLNLGTNAVQAIEEKGVQPGDCIRMHADVLDANNAMQRGFVSRQYIHILFEDTGSGMTEEVRRRAFEPLFSTKERGSQKGQGLGLAMVYNIITRNHQGVIEIESAPGTGTTFHLYLPKAHDSYQKSPEEVLEVTGGEETILLIEDEASVSRLAKKALEKYGYRVLIASDGDEGLRTYRTNKDQIDLIILDLTLPKRSGEMVMHDIREISPGVKIIISSGQGNHASDTHDHAQAFVAKPYRLTDLVKAVRDVLDA